MAGAAASRSHSYAFLTPPPINRKIDTKQIKTRQNHLLPSKTDFDTQITQIK